MTDLKTELVEALEPCPFCGGEGCVIQSPVSPRSAVSCRSCGAAGGLRGTESEAIAAWNTRARSEDGEREIRAALKLLDNVTATDSTADDLGCAELALGRALEAIAAMSGGDHG